ncbi:MAG: rod shape-determining protein MreC [Candidatus Pacebacteria bacterium]|nr:rod shape-determining protein MreC [Candidatus Paceibacterota bacterium]MDR3582838.1 rod shape-determining protein MreC [Candidatus Paceibacterota bacterium]
MKLFTPRRTKLLIIVAIGALLVFLNPKKIFNPIRGLGAVAAYPFEKVFYISSEKTRDMFSFLASIGNLKNDNARLLEENSSLQAKVASLEEQKSENAVLRQQLKLAPSDKYNLAAAMVIGQDPAGSGSWLIIDKGATSGIQTGMSVIVSDGILVGKISEVYPTSAKITLVTDSGSSVNATDLKTGALGILRGAYGLGLVMDMVEQSDTLNVGDSIVTSGLGGLFPKGFLAGRIQQIGTTPDKLFQQAVIVPAVRYSQLEVVFVVKK